jgi:hypothetical protein
MSSVSKTMFPMSIAESECELRDISSAGTKNDLIIRLEQRIQNDGYDPHTLLLPVSTTFPRNTLCSLPRAFEHRSECCNNSVVGSRDGYIDDEVRNICLTARQSDRLADADGFCGSNNSSRLSNRNSLPVNQHYSDTAQQLGLQISNSGAQIRREVKLFSIENRLESIEIALVDIRNSIRNLNTRQNAIENRLASFGCCGAVGHSQRTADRNSPVGLIID